MPLNRTVNANLAPRCRHIKANGAQCAAPARRGRPFCCFHDSAALRNRDFVLPVIEDAASLQIALNKILQALVDKRIDQKTATTLLYGLQLALANMKEFKHEQFLDKCDRERRQREAYAQAQAAAAEAEAEAEEYEDEEEGESEGKEERTADGQEPVGNGQMLTANRQQQKDSVGAPAPKLPAFVDKLIRQYREDDRTFDIDACAGAEKSPPRLANTGQDKGGATSLLNSCAWPGRPVRCAS